MKILNVVLLASAWTIGAAHAQGTLVFDQESSNDEVSPFGSVRIQFYSSLGQSFTPSLSTVGFVQLRQFDITPGNFLGATLVVNLRSTAINGPILGTATPVVLNDSFSGTVNFFFATAVPVTPATTYFLETVVQSGDNWGITVLGDTYSSGAVYASGFAASGSDLWFREGLVVPEPSSALLFLAGGMAAWFVRRKR